MDRQPSFSDFTDGNRLLMVQALEDLSGDATLQAEAKTNTLENFRRAFEPAAVSAILNRNQRNGEITDQFIANPELRQMMVTAMMDDFYQRARSQTSPQPPASPLLTPMEEHAIVYLNRPQPAEGKMLPTAAPGTVVAIDKDGAAYEVEFFEPFYCVATVMPEAIVH